MPLNPPSYIGQDVWFSPDVYVNQVPVALWQPPQAKGIAPQAVVKYSASVEGEDMQFQNPAQAANQAAAYTQKLVEAGVITQADADAAKKVDINNGDKSGGPPSTTPGTINNDTGGIETQGAYPPSTQISRNFTLQQLTKKPFLLCDDHWTNKIERSGNAGLSPGKLVANARLLAVNVLDPIRDRFPDMAINSTIRPNQGNPGSQHILFQAADIRLTRAPYSYNYSAALWIKDNVPYDQLIMEYGYGGSWIHVSYANPPRFPKGSASKLGTINVSTGAQSWGQLTNLDSQCRIQTLQA